MEIAEPFYIRREGPESEDFFVCGSCGGHKETDQCRCGATRWWSVTVKCGDIEDGAIRVD